MMPVKSTLVVGQVTKLEMRMLMLIASKKMQTVMKHRFDSVFFADHVGVAVCGGFGGLGMPMAVLNPTKKRLFEGCQVDHA
jgi:hypothetical protein